MDMQGFLEFAVGGLHNKGLWNQFPDPNKLYRVISGLGNDKCLQINHGSLELSNWNGHDNQKFRFTPNGNNVLIKTAHGEVLSVAGKSGNNEAEIHAGHNYDNAAAQFELIQRVKGNQAQGFTIRTFCGRCLDVKGGNKHKHTKVIQYDVHGGPNQVWYLLDA